MKRTTVFAWAAVFFAVILCGCGLIRIEEEPREALEYTIVKREGIPEELKELIEEKKSREFQLTYQVEKELYLAKGYGQQITGGYSIQVEELGLSPNAIFFETKLLGPEKEMQGEPSYPYIVVKTAFRKEPVQFR